MPLNLWKVSKLLIHSSQLALQRKQTQFSLAPSNCKYTHAQPILLYSSKARLQDINNNNNVSKTCAASFHWLRQLRRIRKSPDDGSAATLVHAFVTSRIDYCRGTEDGYRQAATSAQCCCPCGQWHTVVRSRSDITPPRWASLAGCPREGHLQDGCHGVPLSSRSGTSVPRRSSHHILYTDVASRLRLRSANRHQLIVPRCRLNTYGHRAFSIAGPTGWNSLPDELRDPACGYDSFKQFLKTILFSLY